jgi:hypothetical protein
MMFLGFGRKKITSMKVLALTFTTDHNLITNNNSDWTNSGSTFSKPPDYTYGHASNPISHTENRRAVVKIDFQVNPPNADPTDADVTGAGFGLQFKPIPPPPKFQGGTVPSYEAELTISTPFPNSVQKLTGDIDWTVSTVEDGPFQGADLNSWGHTIYLTMGTPASAPGREAGITQKRMDASVALVAGASSADPHAIAVYITGKFPGYTLVDDPSVPAQFHHPRYLARDGETESGCGAWPANDYFAQKAECQAIIRFTMAVMMQVGCPGDMSIVVVWGDPNNNGAAKEAPWPQGGLEGTTKVVNGKTWYAYMIAGDDPPVPLSVGQVFDPGSKLNYFEACLKLTAGGRTMYYGGGAGDYPSKEQVVTCFQALCWISIINSSNGSRQARVEQIVKTY